MVYDYGILTEYCCVGFILVCLLGIGGVVFVWFVFCKFEVFPLFGLTLG